MTSLRKKNLVFNFKKKTHLIIINNELWGAEGNTAFHIFILNPK